MGSTEVNAFVENFKLAFESPLTGYDAIGLPTLQQRDITATELKMQFKSSCELKNCTRKRVWA